jgi:3-deoxy-D-manno-octulosonic-acid transferase
MRFIYLILICFAAPVAALIAWLRGLRDPSRRERLADRFGNPNLPTRSNVIWVHAASMGEVQASAVLVRRLLDRSPQLAIVMTTMTTTGAARVKALFESDYRGRVTHCYLPYDLPFAVRGFLDRAQPASALILETELWPNLLDECRQRAIRVVIASARISLRTASRYRRFASLFRAALRDVVVAAQTDADAARFTALGANEVRTVGNIKFDIEVPASVREAGAVMRKRFGNRFVWVAGSTHAEEEQAAIDAHRRLMKQRPDALLILVPRHPQRFDEVRMLLTRAAVSFVTQSSGAPIGNDTAILLVDTMGELLSCYAAADLAFVGGSLVPTGGHNLLEPAALGVPTLCGTYMSNAQDVFDRLFEAGGVLQVSSREQLESEVVGLAADSGARRALSEQALKVLQANRGALERTMEIVTAAPSLRSAPQANS